MNFQASRNRVHRATNYITQFDTTNLPWGVRPAPGNCMCFTYSKNNIYKPHSAAGMVGTTAASYLSRRRRI